MQEIGSISDAWCNDYFDAVFRHADWTSQRSKGYCIDVLFDNAIRWMEIATDSWPTILLLLANERCIMVRNGPYRSEGKRSQNNFRSYQLEKLDI